MRHARGIIQDRHVCIIICLHRERKVISAHVHLAAEIREEHPLRLRIVSGEQRKIRRKTLHAPDGLLCDLIAHFERDAAAARVIGAFENDGSGIVARDALRKRVALFHDIIAQRCKILRTVPLFSFFRGQLRLRISVRMVDDEAVQRENQQNDGNGPCRHDEKFPPDFLNKKHGDDEKNPDDCNNDQHLADRESGKPRKPPVCSHPDREDACKIPVVKTHRVPGKDIEKQNERRKKQQGFYRKRNTEMPSSCILLSGFKNFHQSWIV